MPQGAARTKLVTLRAYEVAGEAYLARGRLEDEGIDAALTDEHLVDYNVLYGRTMGGIRLLVRSEDAVRAAEILESTAGGAIEADARLCPACGSERVRHGLASRNRLVQALLALLILATGPLMFVFLRWRWRCDDCGHRWRGAPHPEGEEA